jgi:hypothetical protein
MITMAVIKTLGMIILMHALFSEDTLARLAGQYRKYFELFIILIYPIPFLATGTITGALVAMLSGVLLSLYVEGRKHLFGYQTKVAGLWVKTSGVLSSGGGIKTAFHKFWYGD